MTERILCVDDDPNILHGYQRALRKQFHIEPALGGEEALAAILQHGPYAVVVADMRMPGMDGVQLLSLVAKHSPDTTRMMLTGNADQQTAMDAVNEGHIFRFLTKPCPAETFAKALSAGIQQYRLVTAERELLSRTLGGCIRMLTDLLGLANPAACGRAARTRRVVGQICRELGISSCWQIEMAAMLSQIGCITIPEETLTKVYQRQELTPAEAKAMEDHAKVAGDLLAHIPRLEEIAEIVACQQMLFGDGRRAGDPGPGPVVPLGSRILKVALDWDLLISGGLSEELAVAEMNDRPGWYDPGVLAALRRAMNVQAAHVVRRVMAHELIDGVILADDVRSLRGTLLCSRGHEVTPALRARLKNYAANVGIQGPIRVLVPISEPQGPGAARAATARIHASLPRAADEAVPSLGDLLDGLPSKEDISH